MTFLKKMAISMSLLILVSAIAGYNIGRHRVQKVQITTDQLLALCFPDHQYDPDADPICPAFHRHILEQMQGDN